MKNIKFFPLIFLLIISFACKKEQKNNDSSFDLKGNIVFVVSEGLFNAANSSVTMYDKTNGSITQKLYYTVNNISPGDVLQSMHIHGQEAYLVVNNSNKVEVVNLNNFKSTATIEGLIFPRFMISAGNKGYLTELGSNKLTLLSLSNHQIIEQVDIGKSGDRLLFTSAGLFISNWSSYYVNKPNNTILLFDTISKSITDSLIVVKEPNSMVVDKHGKVWVLSSGGYMNEEFPALTLIDPATMSIEKVLVFADKNRSPSQLCINPEGDTLYYIDNGICKVSISNSTIPSAPFIEVSGNGFYALAVDPVTGNIWTSDPGNYQENGDVSIFLPSGVLIDSFKAGIIPGHFTFF